MQFYAFCIVREDDAKTKFTRLREHDQRVMKPFVVDRHTERGKGRWFEAAEVVMRSGGCSRERGREGGKEGGMLWRVLRHPLRIRLRAALPSSFVAFVAFAARSALGDHP